MASASRNDALGAPTGALAAPALPKRVVVRDPVRYRGMYREAAEQRLREECGTVAAETGVPGDKARLVVDLLDLTTTGDALCGEARLKATEAVRALVLPDVKDSQNRSHKYLTARIDGLKGLPDRTETGEALIPYTWVAEPGGGEALYIHVRVAQHLLLQSHGPNGGKYREFLLRLVRLYRDMLERAERDHANYVKACSDTKEHFTKTLRPTYSRFCGPGVGDSSHCGIHANLNKPVAGLVFPRVEDPNHPGKMLPAGPKSAMAVVDATMETDNYKVFRATANQLMTTLINDHADVLNALPPKAARKKLRELVRSKNFRRRYKMLVTLMITHDSNGKERTTEARAAMIAVYGSRIKAFRPRPRAT